MGLTSGSEANSDTFKATTPSDREVVLTRLFDAPRRLVFEAMTKPEHVRRWWGRLDDRYSVTVCEIDLRQSAKAPRDAYGVAGGTHFGKNGDAVIVLLTGGSKASRATDIRRAREFWRDYMEGKKHGTAQ